MKTIQLLLFTLLLFQNLNLYAQCLNVSATFENDCYNNASGSGQFIINNGTAPFHYNWGTGNTTINTNTYTLTGLYAANYSITIADNLGCDTVINISILPALDSAIIDNALDPFGIGHCQNAAYSILDYIAFQGAPLPGIFSGPGVRNGHLGPNGARFYPDSAVIDMGHTGNVIITYAYPTTTGCIVETKFTTEVHAMPNLELVNLPDTLCPGQERMQVLAVNHVVTGSTGQISYTDNIVGQVNYTETAENGMPIPNFIHLFDSLSPHLAWGHSEIYIRASYTTDTSLGSCSAIIRDTIIISNDCCVWPGDTDNDGIANNYDILPIGLHYNSTGSTRTDTNIDWDCKVSNDWGTGIYGNPSVDRKHIDCNGNGLINSIDTAAIILNWTQTHIKNINTTTSGIPFYIDTTTTYPNDTVSLNIILGTNIVPAYGYGVAFSIHYDNQIIDSNSIVVSFNNSWMGNINTNMIGIYKDFYSQGLVEVGLTRIDHNNAYGAGAIAQIQFIIKDDVLPKINLSRWDFSITNARLVDSIANEILVLTPTTQILVVNPNTSNISIPEAEEDIKAYPNPTSGTICIESSELPIQSTKLYTSTGQLVYENMNSNQFKEFISVENLPSGFYILHIHTDKKLKTMSIFKR